MNQITSYQFSLKAIVFLLLIAQFGANVASHCDWMMGSESELIEFCSSESNEGDNKKSENDEIKIDLDVTKFDNLGKIVNILYLADLIPLHHPEITTPPPESFFLLS